MKRYLTIACLLAGWAGVSALSAQASGASAGLRGYSCSPDLQPPLRALDVTAVMRPVSGTQKLRMRFELLRASHRAGPYRIVHAHNFGHWIGPPDPNLGRQPGDVWQVQHPVVVGDHPGYYRIQVAFAWYGAQGQRLAYTKRTTAACALLELRPDLLVTRLVSVTPLTTHPTRATYVAVIRNRGVTAAGPFSVQMAVAGGAPVTRAVAALGAKTSRHVRFVAPTCTAGQAVTITVDPSRQVLDYDLANNSLTVNCPSAG